MQYKLEKQIHFELTPRISTSRDELGKPSGQRGQGRVESTGKIDFGLTRAANPDFGKTGRWRLKTGNPSEKGGDLYASIEGAERPIASAKGTCFLENFKKWSSNMRFSAF